MDAVASLRAAGYRYRGGAALGPIDLTVAPGERVLLSGPTGSGKTTLLRLLSGVCARAGWGEVTGEVRVGGVDPASLPPSERPRRLGFVGQDPADQLVCGTAADEVAFGPECAGDPADAVERAIVTQLARAGLAGLDARDPQHLSTGQQQRLVTAAALAADARVLLLDEPLAHLDPLGADALLAHLRALADDGITVVLAEHRLQRVAPWASREIHLVGGRVARDGPPIAPAPAPPRIPRPIDAGPVLARATGLRAQRGGRAVLDGVDLEIRAGERVALLGANGSGKSTLLGHLSGRLAAPAWPGALEVPQDPDLTLFCSRVDDELASGPRARGATDVRARVAEIARALDLEELLERPPQGLSRGQRLRVAVGAALTVRPAVLLLDEPTAGQDPESVEALMAGIDRALGDGAILFATHDEELAARWASRHVELRGGRIT